MRLAIIAVVLAAAAGVAHAYPQYQLSHEQTCATCHIAPVGGGLLDDMGELTAEEESSFGGDPRFLHGAIELPAWLRAGGDIRGAAGGHDRGEGMESTAFPMQGEVYVHAAKDAFSVYATAGVTNLDQGYQPWFREHWLMWKPNVGGEGAYVRAGRFMPVFGLRIAEHIFYNRRHGGTPLFGEAYGVNAGWLSSGLEVHATGFLHDSLVDGVEKGDGGALYVEKRLDAAAVGAETRYTTSDLSTKLHGGLTGKLWIDAAHLLIQAEGQVIRQNFKLAAPTRTQLVGQLLATYFVMPGVFVDLGLGHYDEDIAVAKLDRDAADLNVHWFPMSHVELVLMTRVALIGLGDGGLGSGYALVQLHYRI